MPSEAQEQLRLASRQHDQLVEERKRLGAKDNAMLLSQGFGSWSNWWRPKAWTQLSSLVPQWLQERLKIWVDVLKMLDEKISQAKIALARACSGPRPKGVGALSQMQLQSEVIDWSFRGQGFGRARLRPSRRLAGKTLVGGRGSARAAFRGKGSRQCQSEKSENRD